MVSMAFTGRSSKESASWELEEEEESRSERLNRSRVSTDLLWLLAFLLCVCILAAGYLVHQVLFSQNKSYLRLERLNI